jgi:hypothetical protein
MYLVLQYDNRQLTDLDMHLINQNIEYCNKHQYKHLFITQTFDLPPYWIKVYLINELLNSGNYDGILWLDTDACIHDYSTKLEDIIIAGKTFYFSPDKPVWEISSIFNAGVFMVLNNSIGIGIMDEWMKCYNENVWRKNETDKWVTTGDWAGDAYEQGSFCTHILPKYTDQVHVFEWNYFQSNYNDMIQSTPPAIFSLHFCSDKYNIGNYLLSVK